MIPKLEDHLRPLMPSLSGEWVAKPIGYEAMACAALRMVHVPRNRHLDAEWYGHALEFKKGRRHFWFNLVRSAEILRSESSGGPPIHFLLFAYDGHGATARVRRTWCVASRALAAALALDEAAADVVIDLDKRRPRCLNIQSELRFADLNDIADFVI